ncbi:UDP-N-acetylglucosamine--LPS N-acetylglucosamine transferase [Rhodobacteraceae bacterium NNCM2]|nr:UDP-N-acetylglucosamine--LPS N-acetylglucosamine transferase [Coraliihabitans acroporae]
MGKKGPDARFLPETTRGHTSVTATAPRSAPLKVLAIASGGGHWTELRRLRPAWQGCAVTYVTTDPGYRDEVMQGGDSPLPGFRAIPDAHRWQKLRLLRQLCTIVMIVLQVRPDAIISTGAAPGYFALRLGRLIGARTIWVDSIANAEELSLSGAMAGRHADLWLTQWEHLARPGGPHYRGGVL